MDCEKLSIKRFDEIASHLLDPTFVHEAENQNASQQLHHRKDAGTLFVLKSKGPRWGRFFVGPIQFALCYNNQVLCALLGGQCMKAIYLLLNPNGTMKLYEFVVIFGCFMLILAQMPSFHSLRHINLVSLVMCLSYSACATAASIYIGIFFPLINNPVN
ncbi:hypothetical protein JHK82_037883 [Glycine max]|nr:hypothetical protein JHK82_037883 [Glycine max]